MMAVSISRVIGVIFAKDSLLKPIVQDVCIIRSPGSELHPKS